MIAVLRKVISFLDARTRLQILALFVLMIPAALLEMLSIAIIVPVARLVLDGNSNVPYLSDVVESAGFERTMLIAVVCGIFALLFAAKNALLLAIQYVVSRFTMAKLAAFQNRLYRHYLERPYVAQFEDHSSIMIRNLSIACSAVFDALRAMMVMGIELVLIAAAGLTVMLMVPQFALAGAVALLLLIVIFHVVAGPYFGRLGAAANVANEGLLRWSVQGIAALRDIKALECAPYFEQKFESQTRVLTRVRTWRQVSQVVPRALVETIVVVGVALFLIFFNKEQIAAGEFVGAIGVAGLSAMRVIPSINRMLGLIGDMHQYAAEVGTLHEELMSGSRAPADSRAARQRVPSMAKPATMERSFALEDISFAYGPAARVLDGLSLAVRKGEVVGLIGPSGAGKSTLVDLLLGLLTPSAGEIRVDDRVVDVDGRDWRANIGHVPQSIYLLDDTLRRNIAFGVSDADIDEARVHQAVQLSQLGEFIASLPAGLDTLAGEGGTRLSGGQRQRIGIARALYRDPPILIFDEATSALDSDTEREIVAAIESLKGERTMIIVAHRLSTLAGCDRVVMLKAGQITDQGTLAEMSVRHPDLQHANVQMGGGRG